MWRSLQRNNLIGKTARQAQHKSIYKIFCTSEFVARLRLTNQSLLKQYDQIMDFFDQYYHDYEVVTGGERVSRVRVPREAFREALANAIVHRNYQIRSNVHLEFWDQYIKLISPGGLTSDLTKERYLAGGCSVPRNETIANIFFRLKIIETFGTGIIRIKNSYLEFGQEPKFTLDDNLIEVILPVIDYSKKARVTENFDQIINLLKSGAKTRSQIQQELTLKPTTLKKYLKSLQEQNKIERIGNGRATRYRLM